jgi:hypothetical protein
MGKSNSFSNGPDLSAYNGNGPVQVRHDEFCPCHWCLNGHK